MSTVGPRPEFSEKSMGAFALPAKSSTNKVKVFSQVVSCFASGLRVRRVSECNCNRIDGMGPNFLQNLFSVCLLCIRELCFISQIMGWLKQHGN